MGKPIGFYSEFPKRFCQSTKKIAQGTRDVTRACLHVLGLGSIPRDTHTHTRTEEVTSRKFKLSSEGLVMEWAEIIWQQTG